MNNNSAKVALKHLVETKGIDILKSNKQCMSLLKDMVSMDKEGLEDIQVLFNKNLQFLLVDANSKSTADKQNAIDTVYNRLTNRLNEQTAREICNIFIFALGWSVTVKSKSTNKEPQYEYQQNPSSIQHTTPRQQKIPGYTYPQQQYQSPPQQPKKVTKNNGFPKIAVAGICALFIIGGGIALFYGKGNKKDSLNTKTFISESSMVNFNDQSLNESNVDNDSVNTPTTITSTESPTPSVLTIESIPESANSVNKIEVQKISDKITSDKERKNYEFTSTEAGRYRFELSDVPNNIYFKMYLYNADMEQLVYDYDKTNGRGITYDLDANTMYHFVLEQQDNTGSYTLNIGSQKKTEDISAYNKVSDSIQFTDQRNMYSFTSTEAGRYRFELSDVPNNIYFKMYLYNSEMEQLVYDYDKTNSRGITCDLDANSQYYFVIEQQDNVGSYVLNIGRQKECNDISDYERLSDSTQFTDQRNVYSFTPTQSGNYSFILSDVSNNVYYKMYLYNADMEQLVYDYDKTSDRGISQDLKEDEKYYIVIEQQDGVGKYTMNYGISKE